MSFPAKALYDYEAKTPQELSIKVGDVFNVLNQHESGWWVIEHNGKKGAVPGSYCSIVNTPPIVKLGTSPQGESQRRGTPYSPMSISTPNLTAASNTTNVAATSSPNLVALNEKPPANCTYARVVTDFTPKDQPGQLTLHKGDVVYVTDKYKTSWWKGCVKHHTQKFGLFPEANVVEITAEEAAKEAKSEPDTKPVSPRVDTTATKAEEKHEVKKPEPVEPEKPKGWVKATNGKSAASFKYLQKDEPGAVQPEPQDDIPLPYQAKALYSYTGASAQELSFAKGDELTIVERLPKGWLKATLNGKTGNVPHLYLEAKDELQSLDEIPVIGRATVAFEFTSSSENELTIKKDDVVDIIQKLESGWWLGRISGRIGHFPGSYVEELPEEKVDPEVENHAKEEQEKKEKEEIERKVKEDAEKKAKEEEAKKLQEAEAIRVAEAKQETEKLLKEADEKRAKELADKKASEEVAKKALEEAERKAREEDEKKKAALQKEQEEAKRAHEETERKAKEAEKHAREEHERKTLEENKKKEEAKHKVEDHKPKVLEKQESAKTVKREDEKEKIAREQREKVKDQKRELPPVPASKLRSSSSAQSVEAPSTESLYLMILALTDRLDEKDRQIAVLEKELQNTKKECTKLEDHVKEELRIRSDMESFVNRLQTEVEQLNKKVKNMDEKYENSPLWAHREKLRSTGVDLTK